MIDAGLVAPSATIIIPEEEWLSASVEELNSLRNLPLYANQEYSLERDLMTGQTCLRVRYRVPCITTLEER